MLTDNKIHDIAAGFYLPDERDLFARAIEAEVLQAQRPVALHFCNKCGYVGHAIDHNRPGPDTPCDYFACEAKKTLAPCQGVTDTEYYRAECEKLQAKVAELEQFKQMWAISCAERDALQAKVAILDGLSQDAIDGGWTYRGMEAYAKGLEAKVAEQAAEIERLTGCLSRANDQAEHFEREWYLRGDTIAQQSALINKLERCIECYIVQFEAECKALDEKDALIEEQCQVVQNFGSTE